MTSLRPQLRFARQAYRAARYPGDLGAELLPKPGPLQSLSTSVHRRRWMVFGRIGASAAAAAVIVSMLLSRVSDPPRPAPGDGARREMVNWLPSRPDGLPLPRFHAPALPRSLHLDVPEVQPAVDRYQDLAVEYRKLRQLTPDLHMDVKVPTLSDLPTRSVEWLGRVWKDEPAESV